MYPKRSCGYTSSMSVTTDGSPIHKKFYHLVIQ